MTTRWLALPLILSASCADLVACSCAENTAVCQGYSAVSTVFSGTVTQITPTQRQLKSRDAPRRELSVRFSVLKSYRGEAAAELQVARGLGEGDCGFPFQLGETYLVYAYIDPDTNELGTSHCELTKPLAGATSDLAYMAALPTEPKGTRLSGSVYDMDRTEKNGLSFVGLGGASITLHGQHGTRQGSSDQEGKYEIKGLAAGKYGVDVTLPDYLSVLPKGFEFELNGHGCAALSLPLVVNGQIEGRVTDDNGDPLYQLNRVRPGDFLLGVNLGKPPDSASPYVRLGCERTPRLCVSGSRQVGRSQHLPLR